MWRASLSVGSEAKTSRYSLLLLPVAHSRQDDSGLPQNQTIGGGIDQHNRSVCSSQQSGHSRTIG